MKHENCYNCSIGRFHRASQRRSFLYFLFAERTYWDIILCPHATSGELNPEQYHDICNLGCQHFEDNCKKV